MSGRRTFALFLLVLATIGYSIAAFMAATTGFYSVTATDLALTGATGVAATMIPAILAIALFMVIRRDASRELIGGLFAAWFVVAAICAVLIHPYWGLSLAITGAIPLLLMWPELRAKPEPA